MNSSEKKERDGILFYHFLCSLSLGGLIYFIYDLGFNFKRSFQNTGILFTIYLIVLPYMNYLRESLYGRYASLEGKIVLTLHRIYKAKKLISKIDRFAFYSYIFWIAVGIGLTVYGFL